MSVFVTRRGKASATTSRVFNPVFADNSWEDIIEACQLNEVPDTWLVGDSKTMTINGVEHQIDIIGKRHDVYFDGTGVAPLTFQLHNCYGTQFRMNATNDSTGGWDTSEMRRTHLPSIVTLMPVEVQYGLREVKKLGSSGNSSAVIKTTADKLFLPSEIEILGSVSQSLNGEGVQYEYYKNGGSRLKNFSGRSQQWWTRSPSSINAISFVVTDADGSMQSHGASIAYHIAFAFCF